MPHARARPSMWREQFDYYWDGRRRLAIGWFEGAERAAVRPELTVISARDERFTNAPTLVDVISAARWRARIIVVDVPPEHRFVRLDRRRRRRTHPGALRGARAAAGRRLASAPDVAAGRRRRRPRRLSAGGVSGARRRRTAFARADRGGRRAIGLGDRPAPRRRARRQRPRHPPRPGAPHLPGLSEPTRPGGGAVRNRSAAADAREAPFAIMEHWLREVGAPRIILRLRIPDSIEEERRRCSADAALALAMNQRRRLKAGRSSSGRRANPPSIRSPLTTCAQATGDPHEHPDAAGTAEPVVVGNLLALLVDPERRRSTESPCAAAARKPRPAWAKPPKSNFTARPWRLTSASFAPAAGPGDLGIAPVDPGGPAFARLFRVEGDGLAPRRATDDEGLLDELMRRAADAARAATGAAARAVAERAAGLKGRRDKFVASLNGALARAEVAARFEPPGLWDALEPLAQASFAALVIGETGPARARLQQTRRLWRLLRRSSACGGDCGGRRICAVRAPFRRNRRQRAARLLCLPAISTRAAPKAWRRLALTPRKKRGSCARS